MLVLGYRWCRIQGMNYIVYGWLWGLLCFMPLLLIVFFSFFLLPRIWLSFRIRTACYYLVDTCSNWSWNLWARSMTWMVIGYVLHVALILMIFLLVLHFGWIARFSFNRFTVSFIKKQLNGAYLAYSFLIDCYFLNMDTFQARLIKPIINFWLTCW